MFKWLVRIILKDVKIGLGQKKVFNYFHDDANDLYDTNANFRKVSHVINTFLTCSCRLWQYGLWSFQTGGTKLERFLPKNQHTQRKLLNFENWVNGKVSKSAKSPNLLTFKVNFLYQKLSESFSIFFSLKNINLGAHFLLLTFFDNINF